MAKTKATPRVKATSNMAPEGGTTYPYANPNYNPGEVAPNHDWLYRGPSAIERGAEERTTAGMEWRIAGEESGYPRWMWLPKNEGE